MVHASAITKFNVKEEFEDTKGGNQKPYIAEEQTTQWPGQDRCIQTTL